MDFVVCPKDGAKLQVDRTGPVTDRPLPLRCPTCAQTYVLDGQGLRPTGR